MHLLQVHADRITDLISGDADGFTQHRAAQAEHRHLGGAPPDVHDHRADRFGHRQTGTDGGSHRLIDQMHLAGAGHARLAHGTTFNTGDAAGDAHHQTRRHDAAAFIALGDEGLEHLLGCIEIRDHAIAQGTHRTDVARRAAQHQLGFITHRHGDATLEIEGNHRGLLQHNPLAGDVDQRVGRAQVDADVAGQLKTTEEHVHGSSRRILRAFSSPFCYIWTTPATVEGSHDKQSLDNRGASLTQQTGEFDGRQFRHPRRPGGRDPEVRYFESGSMVANLTIAVNRRSRDDEPDWFNLEIWGKQAQVAADYVKKGSLLGIIGSFKLDRWTDRNSGEERSKPVVRVDRLELLGSKRDNEEAAGSFGGGSGGSDEEIPF